MLAVLCVTNRQTVIDEEEENEVPIENENNYLDEGKLVMGSRPI